MSEDMRKARFRVSDATIESPDWMRVLEQPEPAFARPGPTRPRAAPVEGEQKPLSAALRSIKERHRSATSSNPERPPATSFEQPVVTVSDAPPAQAPGADGMMVNEKIQQLQQDLQARSAELEECRSELTSASASYAEACQKLAQQRAQMFEQAEKQLLSLALTVAESIIERELVSEPELHREFARQAIRELGDPRHTVLRASRETYAAIISQIGEPFVDIDGQRIEVSLDPSLEGLGCIASSDDAQVDGRLGERLKAVARAFSEELADKKGDDS